MNERIQTIEAELAALRVLVTAIAPLVPEPALLVRRFDAGTLATEAALLNDPRASEDYRALVLGKLSALRAFVADEAG